MGRIQDEFLLTFYIGLSSYSFGEIFLRWIKSKVNSNVSEILLRIIQTVPLATDMASYIPYSCNWH